jgi:tetratricopeptide (TPR) repeat protein
LKRYDEAIKCYDKAIEINSLYYDVYNSKGLALSLLEKYDEAMKYYDKAVEIDPNNVDALNGKGMACGMRFCQTLLKAYTD